MKAMIWKELRENLKWAVLAMLALGLAEFYCLLEASDSSNDSAATLCKSSFLTATTFGCAVAGIILGLVQILPEQKRDQWAALLHRPVTRGTIFRGKAFAGILLYLLATIPPFLACVWYVATPGHYAVPFLPAMALPGIADICAGTMFYFAALFVGVRRGPWYGARSFGFLAACLGSAFTAEKFGIAMGLVALMALTLFTAGWGAISTNGRLRDQPWFGRLATILIVVCGAFVLIGFSIGLLFMFSSSGGYYGTSYDVDTDGRPLKYVQSQDTGMTITDLAGNVIHDKGLLQGSGSNRILSFAQVTSVIGHSGSDDQDVEDYMGYRNNRAYVVSADGSYDRYTETWYYLPQEHQFVGYYAKSKQRIGAIGLDGFHPGDAPAAPFPRGTGAIVYQVQPFDQFGSVAYHNDFDQRKLTPIFSQPGKEIFGVVPMESSQDRTVNLNWGAVALLDQMMIVDKTGQVIASLPYHQNMNRWGMLTVAVMPDKNRFFLRYSPNEGTKPSERSKMPSYLEEMDTKGNLLNTYTLPPVPQPKMAQTWQEYVMESVPPSGLIYGYLAYVKIGALCGSKSLAREWDDTNWDSTNGDEGVYLKAFLLRSSLLSIGLALVTIVWARRLHFSPGRAWAWTLFVLAFNLAGFITFRLVADWPVCVKCPQCNRKRPVEETVCPHCQSLWPTPKLDGIEIFEKKESVAQTVS